MKSSVQNYFKLLYHGGGQKIIRQSYMTEKIKTVLLMPNIVILVNLGVCTQNMSIIWLLYTYFYYNFCRLSKKLQKMRNSSPREFWFIALFKKELPGASLVAQWLRIHLPMQRTWVWGLVREDPTCRGAAKLVHHNYWACTLEPVSHNYWARVPQLPKPVRPRACALQQEKPPQWEARALQWK